MRARRARWRLRLGAALLALVWLCAVLALERGPWPVTRAHALLPALLLLTAAAHAAPARLAVVFAGFAAAWLSWGAGGRFCDGAGPLLACLHDAAHERVWLPAAALAALAGLRAADTADRT